jgi:hypothetical protein
MNSVEISFLPGQVSVILFLKKFIFFDNYSDSN